MAGLMTFDIFLQRIKDELPQAQHIKKEDAKVWYDSVAQYDPERLNWHFERLKGLGGSDIGEIAAWKLGVFNIFKTPRDIIDEKLLRKSVEPQNNNMRRGTYLEPVIQQIFLEDYNARTRPDLIEKIANQIDPAHPWLRGNVDDVAEIGGGIFIVDYKAPTEAKEKTPIQYAAQVHQYGHLYELAENEKPYSHIVASFDYDQGNIVAVDVPYDEVIMTAVLVGGDEVWEHVLDGTYPDRGIAKQEGPEYTEEEKKRIEQLEEEFLRYKLMADEAKKKYESISRELGGIITHEGEYLLKGKKMPLDVLSGSVRQKLDNEKVEQILAQTGEDVATFQVVGNKLDENKVLNLLHSEYGEDMDIFYLKDFDTDKVLEFCEDKGIAPPVQETFSVQFKANKKSLNKQAVAIAKESAAEIVEQGSAQINLGDNDIESTVSPAA